MAFTCPCCGRVSHNENDEREGYCGACCWWTGNPELAGQHDPDACPVRSEDDEAAGAVARAWMSGE
jgi:hypothetical protein